jgi:hypothetical protein
MAASPPDPDAIVRRRFTKDEDRKLMRLVEQFGAHDWAKVSSVMYGRTQRQCRQRYKNYLSQNRQRSAWTAKEEELVIAKFREVGPKWVHIATFLPGRTGNDVKNRWHKRLIRRFVQSESDDSAGESAGTERRAAPPPPPPPQGAAPVGRVRPALSPFLQSVLNQNP